MSVDTPKKKIKYKPNMKLDEINKEHEDKNK
jgi:hypothetical protein